MKHFQSKVLTAAILATFCSGALAVTNDTSTDNTVQKAAAGALLAAYKNAQDINGFGINDDIYTADPETNKVTHKKATQEDVDNDDFKGLGLKEVVAQHDQSLANLTETVEENSEALVKTAEVVNEISADVKANTAAIDDTKDDLALVAATAINNAQEINGFKAGETIYDIGEDGTITKKEATAADVEADDFKGLGLKEVVAEHDQNLADLTETVNENSEALVKTAEVVNEISTDVKANKAAIEDTQDDLALMAATAINNAQEINGFKAGDTLYDIDENGKITKKEATAADVEADDFKGLGLKEVVAEHDQSLEDLTETVNENGEALVKTAKVVNEISTDVKANKAAIEENKAAITKKADQTALDAVSDKVTANETAIGKKADKTALDAVSDKVTANETAIGKKANSADVYTKTESDSRFVKVESSIGGLDTTTKGLDTRLAAAEKSVADHGTRLASAEKSITEHGTRLNGLDKAVSDLRKETRQGLAEQAALSGLFQPYNVGRFNVTAAVGGYKSESAVAIGTGFRFTENFAAKAGVAVGTSSGSSAAYHVGVNYEW
ncbi:YadA C-terminal domain-containing protein [Neisseria cinerea]|uniref:YadA C-terminal domain-containing protein n=1 Tax=Neisseria cinerea TaxID=483 RepID=UPI0028D6451E|nr:YadA C-terminal domain-containing protein [Neisseria cinerea]